MDSGINESRGVEYEKRNAKFGSKDRNSVKYPFYRSCDD
jgi:hypothetical protein